MSNVRAFLILFLFVVMVAVAALWQGSAVHFKLKRRKSFPSKFHKVWCWLFGIRVVVVGKPARAGGVLFVANHQSYLDIPIVGSTTRMSFISRHDIAKWPMVGTMVRLQESVLVERKRRGKASEQMAAVRTRLAQGDSILIFAEGTTSDGGHVMPFKSTLLAAAVDEPGEPAGGDFLVQPVSISYVGVHGMPLFYDERLIYAWIGDFSLLPHVWAMLKAGPIDAVVQFLPPIADTAGGRKAVAAAAEGAVRAGHQAARGLWRNAA